MHVEIPFDKKLFIISFHFYIKFNLYIYTGIPTKIFDVNIIWKNIVIVYWQWH